MIAADFKELSMQDDRTSSTHLRIKAEGQIPETETLEQLQQLAECGYPTAQNDLGWTYQNGRGVPQDDKEAVRWYRKAAQQGYAIAQDNLGWMYQQGRGVPQDDVKAVKWFRKAAEGGSLPKAQDNLGWMYQHGRGVPQNDAEAVKWFRKAAEGGYSLQPKIILTGCTKTAGTVSKYSLIHAQPTPTSEYPQNAQQSQLPQPSAD